MDRRVTRRSDFLDVPAESGDRVRFRVTQEGKLLVQVAAGGQEADQRTALVHMAYAQVVREFLGEHFAPSAEVDDE